MKVVLLSSYSSEKHFNLLSKWLTNKELMHGWGIPAFKAEDIPPWTKDPTRVILMVENKETGEVVGFVNFYEWNKENATAKRGTLIDPQYQNQGFGKAAIQESNKYGFEKMKLKRIELYVEADNERSRHVTEKLGYTFDRFDPVKKKYYYYMERK